MKLFNKETSEIVTPIRELSAEEMLAVSGAGKDDVTIHGNGLKCNIASETFVNGAKVAVVVCK